MQDAFRRRFDLLKNLLRRAAFLVGAIEGDAEAGLGLGVAGRVIENACVDG